MDRTDPIIEIVSRTLVELSVKAQSELIDRHGYAAEDFIEADGTETLYDGYGNPLDTSTVIGAPLYWYRRHMEGTWSCMLACQLLDAIQPDLEDPPPEENIESNG